MLTSAARAEVVLAGGQINSFTRVTAWDPTQNIVTVADPGIFSLGDKLMIWQAKGATISQTNDATYGDIQSLEEAGSYTIATVQSKLSGGRLELLCSGVLPDFDIDSVVQAVRVPYFDDDVRITGKLTAQPWSQTSGLGGVIALISEGDIIFEANTGADAAGDGFEAGDESTGAGNQSANYVCAAGPEGGRKGEGVAIVPQAYCRGKLATGGGGGNSHNAGGGGGANFGAGGIGGRPWPGAGPAGFDQGQTQGIGGQSLAPYYGAAATDKVFFGGGGGGGNQNNGGITKGGRGGGFIFFTAERINAGSNTMLDVSGSDGDDLPFESWNDGAAGGGAGGSIVLNVESFVNAANLTLNATGGRGGDFGRFPATCHGPGGGGGGGVIYASNGVPAGSNTSVVGGRAGILKDGWSSAISGACGDYGITYGAAPGGSGAVLAPGAIQSQECKPELSLTKLIDTDNVHLDDATGHYHLPLRYVVENTGGFDLFGVQLEDDVNRHYGALFESAALDSPAVDCSPADITSPADLANAVSGLDTIDASHCPTANNAYNGGDGTTALSTLDVLAQNDLPASPISAGARIIESGQGFVVYATAVIDPNADLSVTDVTNTATVSGTADTDADQNFIDETAISVDDSATFTIRRLADLGVTKTDCRAVFEPGTSLRYSVIVSNDGPHTAENIELQEILPSAAVGSSTWTCSNTLTDAGACTVSDLSGAVVGGGASCPTASGVVPADGILMDDLRLPPKSGLHFIVTVPISDDMSDF